MSDLGAVFAEAHARATGAIGTKPLLQYQRDPLAYCADILKLRPESLRWGLVLPKGHAWDGTPDPLCAALTALAEGRDAGVESGTGTGKSVMGAAAMLWFLGSWPMARVFSFASKEDQLRFYIWTELRRLKLFEAFRRSFPEAVLNDLSLKVRGGQDDGWSAHGYSVGVRSGEDVSAKAAGMHAEHMLLLYEETQGIHRAVIEAGFNTATAPHNLRLFLGNPDNQLDPLHQACTSPGVVHIRASALDHPNVVLGREVVPGAVSAVSIEKRELRYGAEHRLYRSRVRGISPAEAEEALIKLSWVNAAVARWREMSADGTLEKWGAPALGVDVANSEAGDEAAIAEGRGRVCLKVESFPCPNANELGWRVAKQMDLVGIADDHVGVDTVGVGAGCFNELARSGPGKKPHYVRSLQGGSEYDYESEEEFVNLRAQMWWKTALDLQHGRVELPPDVDLAADLVTPTWTTRNEKILIEAKEKLRERLPGKRSPNKGDAFVYWNWVRDRKPVVSAVPTEVRMRHGDPDVFRQAVVPASDARGEDTASLAEGTDDSFWVPGSIRTLGGSGW